MLDPSRGVLVFTDGSAWPNDKTGGWAWLAVDGFSNEVTRCGSELGTSIGRMELTAAIEALNSIREICGSCDVLLYSDSEYVVLGNNDRTRARRKNVDLWGLLDEAVDAHECVVMEHVYGHQDSHYNNMVDGLAGEARRANYIDAEARTLPEVP